MNTPERNIRNTKKMEKLGVVLNDSEEDKLREQRDNSAINNATREYPFPTARKFAWVLCGGFWLFCLGGLLFGVDVRALFPFLFFSLATISGLHIPMFYVKRKIFDVVIGAIFTLCCIGVGLSLLSNPGVGL